MPLIRRASRDAALVELQRLHAAILASRAQRGVGSGADARSETPSPEAVATRELTRRLQADRDAPADHVPEPATRSRRGWWLALGAAVIVAGTWAALTLTQRREAVTEAARATPVSEPPREGGPAAAPASVDAASPAPPTGTPAKAIRVTLETIRPVWMRATVDGVRTFEGELPAGEKLSIEGNQAVVVRAGDAGGVRATVNGVDRGPLGRDGWPLTMPFTLDPPAPITPPRE